MNYPQYHVSTGTSTSQVVYNGNPNQDPALLNKMAKELSQWHQLEAMQRRRAEAMIRMLHHVQDLLEDWTEAASVLDGQPSISVADIVKQLGEAMTTDDRTFVELDHAYLDLIARLEGRQ